MRTVRCLILSGVMRMSKRFGIKSEVPLYEYDTNDKSMQEYAVDVMRRELAIKLVDKLCTGTTYLAEMTAPRHTFDYSRSSINLQMDLRMDEFVRCKDCARTPKMDGNLLHYFHCPVINKLVCGYDYCFLAIKRGDEDE